MNIIKRIVLVFAALLLLTGCGGGSEWESADHTMSWISSRLSSPCSKYIGDKNEDDLSDKALAGYNKMLGFVENYMGIDDYRIYDYYWAYPDNKDLSAIVINIVLPGFEKELEKNDEAAIMLTCDPDTMQVKEGVGGFLYAQSWTEKLSAELIGTHPEYHMNTWYIMPYYVTQAYHIKEPDKRPVDEIGRAEINIFVPPGTPETDVDRIYDDLEPLLDKYSVTVVTIIAPSDNAALEKIIAEESFTGNGSYNTKDGAEWLKSYALG